MFGLRTAIVILLFSSLTSRCLAEETALDRIAWPLRLPNTDGDVVEIRGAADAQITVLCFLGVECPMARLYGPRLDTLADRFAAQGVRFVGINSNRQDSMDDLRRYASELDIRFALTKDYNNVVADQFGATRTAEIVVLDAEMKIRYRGRIDDQYAPGIARSEVARPYLQEALEALVAGDPVSEPQTKALGCLIGRIKEPVESSEITYTSQIAGILQRHCIECHRPGEIGPFSLLEYDEVVGWADMMVEVIDEGRMPPWHASPDFGHFQNARWMPDADKTTLRKWVEAGAPYGDPRELPEPKKFASGWQLRETPELVLAMNDRPFIVPADGTVEYQYFVVDPQFEEDKWVTAAEVIPGNRAAVHHSIVFIRPPDGSRFRGIGWLAGYVPGQRTSQLDAGRARFVPAGSKLVFQQHYTPTGKEETDLTRIGMIFGHENEITHEVYTLFGLDQEFEIPPHDPNFVVHTKVSAVPESAMLLAVMPHMHLRGKAFECFIRRGKDRSTMLLVPQYDFNWQHMYRLAEPLPLSNVDALEFAATFDNSSANPVNPDPTQRVTWGDQTWEEMAVGFFEISVPREAGSQTPVATATVDPSPRIKAKADAFVDRFLKQFDANEDGEVTTQETPLTFQRFAFWEVDSDNDERLTPAEIRSAAIARLQREEE